ncbi:hypothetical protein D6827_03750 [Candidatus Parcubacteria bacterium]|nr:MAG: hypothetical protein D6827_03750 [Candidatus Parcubacteria bacterium]
MRKINMNTKETTAILAKYYLFFQHEKLTPEIAKAWHELFKNVPAKKFELAVKACVLKPDCKFFPKPCEVMEQLQANPNKLTPDEAWMLACKACSNVANWKNAELPQEVREAIRLISPERIAYTPQSKLDFVKRDFLTALADIEKRKSLTENFCVSLDVPPDIAKRGIDY